MSVCSWADLAKEPLCVSCWADLAKEPLCVSCWADLTKEPLCVSCWADLPAEPLCVSCWADVPAEPLCVSCWADLPTEPPCVSCWADLLCESHHVCCRQTYHASCPACDLRQAPFHLWQWCPVSAASRSHLRWRHLQKSTGPSQSHMMLGVGKDRSTAQRRRWRCRRSSCFLAHLQTPPGSQKRRHWFVFDLNNYQAVSYIGGNWTFAISFQQLLMFTGQNVLQCKCSYDLHWKQGNHFLSKSHRNQYEDMQLWSSYYHA